MENLDLEESSGTFSAQKLATSQKRNSSPVTAMSPKILEAEEAASKRNPIRTRAKETVVYIRYM
jgi:hypothetical protein